MPAYAKGIPLGEQIRQHQIDLLVDIYRAQRVHFYHAQRIHVDGPLAPEHRRTHRISCTGWIQRQRHFLPVKNFAFEALAQERFHCALVATTEHPLRWLRNFTSREAAIRVSDLDRLDACSDCLGQHEWCRWLEMDDDVVAASLLRRE